MSLSHYISIHASVDKSSTNVTPFGPFFLSQQAEYDFIVQYAAVAGQQAERYEYYVKWIKYDQSQSEFKRI